MITEIERQNPRMRFAAVVATGLAVFAGMLLLGTAGTTAVAHAQGAADSEYLQPPGGGGGGGEVAQPGTSAQGPVGTGAVGTLAGGPSANAGKGGSLPFTGYPMTPLILLLLLLLLLGLLVRMYVAVRQRMRARLATAHGRSLDLG